MAAPHVAGAAAMVEAMGVTDGPSVRATLESSARRVREGYDKDLYGAGILDAEAATAHLFWTRLVVRSIALGGLAWLVARRIRKRHGKVAFRTSTILGAFVTSVGLFPLWPLLRAASPAGAWQLLGELAMRPIGEWDLMFGGAGLHKWLLLASALPALALVALGFSSPRVRPLIGGVALGTAALLTQVTLAGDTAFVAGGFLMRVWTVTNALICLWLASASLDVRSRQ
jgi:serine protease